MKAMKFMVLLMPVYFILSYISPSDIECVLALVWLLIMGSAVAAIFGFVWVVNERYKTLRKTNETL